MSLLSLSLKLIVKDLGVNQRNLERQMVWLTRECQVAKWHDVLKGNKDGQPDYPHTQKGRQE